jgi:hypothetical protein
MYAQPIEKNKKYFKPKDGQLQLPAREGEEGAVEVDIKDREGKVIGTKWVKLYKFLVGTIEGISFYDGQTNDGRKFRSLNVYLNRDEDTGDEPVLSMSAESREAQDFMSRLPNIDLSKEVRLMPYSFEDTGNRGISIMQKDESGDLTVKIENYFTRKEGDKWITEHGYPEATEEDKSDWAFYFKKVGKFLQKNTEELAAKNFAEKPASKPFVDPDETINPADIPF